MTKMTKIKKRRAESEERRAEGGGQRTKKINNQWMLD